MGGELAVRIATILENGGSVCSMLVEKWNEPYWKQLFELLSSNWAAVFTDYVASLSLHAKVLYLISLSC